MVLNEKDIKINYCVKSLAAVNKLFSGPKLVHLDILSLMNRTFFFKWLISHMAFANKVEAKATEETITPS